ncbi:TRAP transporter small permease [Desulfosediminicola sp.]|uniref:TRAP transporter small permease n=1 Tax=Desulfosediminicola sp. TaxID=2886825 RepID=UPI003AF2E47B
MVRNWLNRLYTTSGWLAAFFVAAICLLVVAQVMLNLIDRICTVMTGSAIGLTIPSYADFTGFFLAAASFLALAHTLREGDHIRVTLLISNLPGKIRRIAEFWCLGVAAGISIYFSYYMALLTWESWSYNDLSAGLVAVPIWIPQCGMLIGLLVLTIAVIDEFIEVLMGRAPSYSKKKGPQKGEEVSEHGESTPVDSKTCLQKEGS